MGLTATKYKETEVGLIPEDWDLVPFDKVFAFHSTSNYSKAQMSDDDEVGCIHYGLIHEIPETQYNLKNGIKYYVSSDQAKYDIVRDGDVIMVDASEDEEGVNKSVEVCGIGNKKYISGLHTYLLRDKNGSLADNFRGILLNSQLVKSQMLQLAVGMKVFGVSKTQLIKVKLPLPPTLTEQKTIAQVLSDMDALIQVLEKKIVKKKHLKKGMMQKLLTPKEDWEVKTLGDFLDYEQPTNYIVESTEYNDNYDIPVLTAGKSFILGYTNEKDGIFENYPVIILDDFTTATKFVDFPFKVKSSALKILKPKNKDVILGFIFEIMQQINFPLGDHKRHWIGEFQPLEIMVPKSKNEQIYIAQILADMGQEIAQLEEKLSKYQLAKQGMMQQLLSGKTRLV